MPSQTDLDEGGTSREWVQTYMGPSIGMVWAPRRNPLAKITAAGTYVLDWSTNLVEVSVAGAVVIILPSAIDPSVPAGVLPGRFVKASITICDIGGFALDNPITIQPASIAETIVNLPQIQIDSNYGQYVLSPSNALKGWTYGS